MKKGLLFLLVFAFIFLPLSIHAENGTTIDKTVINSVDITFNRGQFLDKYTVKEFNQLLVPSSSTSTEGLTILGGTNSSIYQYHGEWLFTLLTHDSTETLGTEREFALFYSIQADATHTFPDSVKALGSNSDAAITDVSGFSVSFNGENRTDVHIGYSDSWNCVMVYVPVGHADSSHEVYFNTNGGQSVNRMVVRDGGYIPAENLPEPTREGYRFLEWYTDEGLAHLFEPEVAITADMTLYAKWKGVISSLELTGTLTAPKAGDPITTPNISIKNFNGDKNPGGVLGFQELVWQEVTGPNTFDKVNATGNFEAGKTYVIRAIVEINDANYEYDRTAIRDNVVFTGHDLTHFQDNETTVGKFIDSYYIPRKFTVTVVTPESPMFYETDEPYEVEEGSKIPVPQASIEYGYNVLGWYTDEALTHQWDFDNDTVTGNINLYPKYVQVDISENPDPDFTLTFDYNGGTRNGRTQDVNTSKGFAPDITEHFLYLDDGVTPPSGKEFDYVTINGTRYNLGDQFMLNQDVTIVYYWKTIGGQSEGNSTIVDPQPVELLVPSISVDKGPNNTLYVNWQSNPGATRFEVYRATSNNKKTKWTKFDSYDATSYEQLGLKYGTTYYYKVKACNDTTCTGYSNVASRKVIPDRVENIRIESAGGTNIKIAYDKVPVTGYEVRRSTKPDSGFKKVAFVTKSGTLTYNNKKLKNATTYYYKVRAYKTVKGKKIYGAWSDVVSATTGPAKPKKPSIKATDFETIVLGLKATKTATRYEVQRSTNKKKGFGTIAITKSLEFVDNVQTGTTFYYKVRACNDADVCSGWSSVVSKKATLNKPSIKLVQSEQGIVTLRNTTVDGAFVYEVQRSTNKKRGFKTFYYTTDDSLFLNEVGSKKTYYYRVRAVRYIDDKKVYSAWSKVLTVKSKKIDKNDQRANANRTAKLTLFAEVMSRKGLIDRLVLAGYEEALATEVVDSIVEIDWNEEASYMAMLLLQAQDYTKDELINALENQEGFTHEQAVYGADNCGAY